MTPVPAQAHKRLDCRREIAVFSDSLTASFVSEFLVTGGAARFAQCVLQDQQVHPQEALQVVIVVHSLYISGLTWETFAWGAGKVTHRCLRIHNCEADLHSVGLTRLVPVSPSRATVENTLHTT